MGFGRLLVRETQLFLVFPRGRVVVEADDRPKRQLEARLRGVGPNNIRQSNQRAAMTVLSVAPGASNAEISRLTGLAPQTVSAVLVDLESEGLLLRGQVRRDGGRGQPATPIFLRLAEAGLTLDVI